MSSKRFQKIVEGLRGKGWCEPQEGDEKLWHRAWTWASGEVWRRTAPNGKWQYKLRPERSDDPEKPA